MNYDITSFVVAILLGLGLGIGAVALYVWFALKRFHGNLNEMIQETLEEVKASLVGIIIEEHDGQLYAYRDSDRQFLCQGANLMEIRQKFQEQYPEKTAFLTGGDPDLIERLKSELATIKEQEKNENSVSV
jgi:hypothetical protein